MSFPTTIVTGLYLITLKLGLLGNCWVILSVLRTRPRNGSLTPSDRLRGYIGLLAVLDLLVTLSLAIRIVYVILPNASIDTWSCRTIFIVNDLLKLGSITCLACISIERYITIRKPFNSRVRRRLIQFTPVVALVILALVLSGIATLASNVTVRDGPTSNVGMDCTQMSSSDGYYSAFVGVARWIVALSFLLQLTTVSSNYGQIVRHVRRKFWQRKARVVANSRNSHSSNSQHKQPLVSEPRYMKDMTWAIVRIAVFHMICWLPYCLIQILPYSISLSKISTPLPIYLTTSVRMINTSSTMYDGLAWLAFIADWLTYVNSAGDWVFYAAMNRDLRSIIRQTTERRKRSTLSQQSPSSNLHRSLKRQMTQSLALLLLYQLLPFDRAKQF
ncbi:7 transmembrane receptor (rhodopsin family) domain-containing protein [Ditylenchus destructor]|nr:7 transmembrane receptor (rhodopsin family) domain-containing protein [Ditylenchus destructor]